METLIDKLRTDFPKFHFVAADIPQWSASLATISYRNADDDSAAWGLLHELGHAQLGHNDYGNDIELLKQEVAAWERAYELAAVYDIAIDDAYVERCLDSYRDWLHHRSECPACGAHGLESLQNTYSCLNCNASWKVGSDRFCRTYRAMSKTN
ncbi:MAG TPA: hypothetical protein VIM53_03710 [Candidatus Saccharimonadales bacterium]